MTVAENIKAIRKQKGLTQTKLAELTGLSVRSIQDFEYGKITPKLETLLNLSKHLHVSPKDINPEVKWDDYIDTGSLSKEVSVWESITETFGEEPASFFNDFLSLNPEGQQKASEYMEFLMQKHRR